MGSRPPSRHGLCCKYSSSIAYRQTILSVCITSRCVLPLKPLRRIFFTKRFTAYSDVLIGKLWKCGGLGRMCRSSFSQVSTRMPPSTPISLRRSFAHQPPHQPKAFCFCFPVPYASRQTPYRVPLAMPGKSVRQTCGACYFCCHNK